MLRTWWGKNKGAFILTGYSLDGALAILLREKTWLLEKLEGVYTFGRPRAGDKQFENFMTKNLKKYDVKYWRYVYCNDIVPRLPYDNGILSSKQFGPCLYFNSFYKGKVSARTLSSMKIN